ncbi:caspase family protein [Frigidibacter sp. ROC022]|uniref:caspase family protein n=1 Tax=Frigidibacter sp. ROC022 TaxID=2971796 RepID=UPI00215AB46F|nr:caspase family protein [Frigidibacter sp. ROC022]MCR8723317.1 caspase family protein [Frigidibacter sp. ROC022]
MTRILTFSSTDLRAAVARVALRFCLALALLCGLGPMQAARAEPRIALVVGNSGYQSVSALDNPKNDAALIAEALGGLGFEVTLLTDANLTDFRRGVSQFGQALRAAGPEATGLFYYAGHGVQSFGTNYLLPVDASLVDAADLDLVAVEAQSILRQMSSARNRTNIVILDACRNNPFEAIRSIDDNGLAEMKAPTGTFLAYATAPGAVALDGTEANSPFTKALAQFMPEPGVPIEQMFKRVRVAVLEATGGQQTPWDTSSLTSDFQFAAGQPMGDPEDALWASVEASRDPVQIMLFMRAYPDGKHFEEARALLAAVMEFETGTGAETPVTKPPEEAPKPAGPSAAEKAAFDAAQAAGTVELWEAFLRDFPDSLFREAAEIELAAAQAKEQHDPDVNPPGGEVAPLTAEIFFDQPLVEGGDNVLGKRIDEIILGSPMFVPFEGIPDEVWKGKQCANCHEWTQEALCDQGNFYVSKDTPDAFGPIHPLGGQFRQVLKAWAGQGCR